MTRAVLILDQFGELGGAQLCLLDVAAGLRERGWSVHVAAPAEGPLGELCRASGCTFDALRGGGYTRGRKSVVDAARFLLRLPLQRAAISRLAERYAPDLLYCNGPRLLPAAAGAAPGTPMLFHCHSYLRQRYAAWLAGHALARRKAAIAASCAFVARPLLRYAGTAGVRVVYNGVPGPAAERRDFAPGGLWRIGMVGRIAPEKGQAVFLKAAKILAAVRGDCRFFLCGALISRDPAAVKYAAEVQRLSAEAPVEFTGWREDVYGFLANIDILAVPSAPGEATTRVILEAYAAGVPVVAFASGGIPEVVQHERTGFLVDGFTPDALARGMETLLSLPAARFLEISRHARGEWRARFTLDAYRRRMAEIVADTAGLASIEALQQSPGQ